MEKPTLSFQKREGEGWGTRSSPEVTIADIFWRGELVEEGGTGARLGYSLPKSSVRSSKKLMRTTMSEPITPTIKNQVTTVMACWASAITREL